MVELCCARICSAGAREIERENAGDEFYKKYEAKLRRATRMAFISNGMYGLTWFLGFCGLTWASAVILGGLITYMTRHDYYSVVVLLLLEAVRLATTTFFGKLVTLKLVHGTADPHRLVYDNVTKQKLLGLVRILEQAVQLVILTITILLPIRRLLDLDAITTMAELVHGFDGMKTSLRIFYVLVLVNSSISVAALMFSKHVVPLFLDSVSLRKFYEKIVWKGMDEGLLHATDFEFLSWAFQMQADEYRRNMRALVVMSLYEDMMKFLYYHPKYKGFEAAKTALDSTDIFEREAAGNIVGLWVELVCNGKESGESTNPVLSRLSMQTKLLAKLADMLDNDESGRAATVSFMNLARRDPKSVLMVRSEGKDEKVADILMDQIHRTVEIGRPKNALMYIKAMIPLLQHLLSPEEEMSGNQIEHGRDKYCTPTKLERLKEDMRKTVTEHTSSLKRLLAVASKAYSLFDSKDDQRIQKLIRNCLMKELPTGKEHILADEAKYLEDVLGKFPTEWQDTLKIRPFSKEPPSLPLLAWHPTSLIASLVSVMIIVICSIFIMRYAHF